MPQQPQPNHDATHSGSTAKTAPRNAREEMAPGGPVKWNQQTYRNPGATPNLRGVEPNTERHKGFPNPHQSGTAGHYGEPHAPGFGEAGNHHGNGVATPVRVAGRHSDAGVMIAHPTPGHSVHENGADV